MNEKVTLKYQNTPFPSTKLSWYVQYGPNVKEIMIFFLKLVFFFLIIKYNKVTELKKIKINYKYLFVTKDVLCKQ